MRNTLRNLDIALGRHVPAKRIFIKTDGSTGYVELSPLKQIALVSAGILLGCWLFFATAALLLHSFVADTAQNQARILQNAYEERIAALTAERDKSAADSLASRERFSLALAEVSQLHGDLLLALEENNALDAELTLKNAKFAVAVSARATSEAENQSLLAASTADVGGAAVTRSTEMAETLQTISLALAEAARERDAAASAADTFEAQIAGLQLKMKINAERQDRMMVRLEEAVTGSFAPLEGMFEAAGLDVGRIVGDVQLSHSGTGGPLTPVLSTKGSFEPMEEVALTPNERFQNLLHDIDAVNSLQIAAVSLPFANPVDGSYRFTSGFGGRNDPISGGRRKHEGLDFAGSSGTDIVAAGDGEVIFAGRQSGYGNLVKIRHSNGYETLYGHLSAISVDVGDHVSRGDHIGDMGNTGRSTGTHLHYEIRLSGDPLNPMTFLEAARNVL